MGYKFVVGWGEKRCTTMTSKMYYFFRKVNKIVGDLQRGEECLKWSEKRQGVHGVQGAGGSNPLIPTSESRG